jgi:rhodanese-related sulfurtransferase
LIVNEPICVHELNGLTARPSDTQLVDVRSATEYAAGHVPGAVNIPMDQIEARLEDLRPGSPIVLICKSGQRAAMTSALLEPRRNDVTVLAGGTDAWAKAGFPLVLNTQTRWALERQVRFIAGALVVIGVLLALGVTRYGLYLALLVGLGLTFAGVTDVCLMASLLSRMPWNRSRKLRPAPARGKVCSLRNVSSPGERR